MSGKRTYWGSAATRPHVFEPSGFWEATGQICKQCDEPDHSMWHWVEVDGRLEPPQ